MSATEELRRLLDERGVEWEDMSIFPLTCTSWLDHDGEPCTALEGTDDIPDGKLSVQSILTPAQAIAATLGTGTCHEVKIDRHYRGCSECGYRWEYMYAVGWQIGPNFCPNCGRKVVEE